ncbi:kinase-like domain-containing protein [Mycena amicta]|nr:kinase-like domain-containing protein [Mycena amicta]
MEESRWLATFQAFGLVTTVGDEASVIELSVSRWTDSLSTVSKRPPTTCASNRRTPLAGALSESILVKTLEDTAEVGADSPDIFGQTVDEEPSDEERKFSALLYAYILGRCCQCRLGSTESGSFVPLQLRLPLHLRDEILLLTDIVYREGPLIAGGTFGAVYVVYDDINKRVLSEKRCYTSFAAQKALELKNKIDLMKKLDHPHIVRFIDARFVLQPHDLRIVTEYVQGGTVRDIAQVLGPMTEVEARAIFRQLVDGLEYLHSQRPPIVHRDIKGANLLITLDGCVKIADLGLAPPIPDAFELYSHLLPWMAPEIMTGASYGCAVDIWSTACTILEMIEGGHPWIASFDMPVPAHASPELKRLFHAVFVSPAERLTIEGVKHHRWMWQEGEASHSPD